MGKAGAETRKSGKLRAQNPGFGDRGGFFWTQGWMLLGKCWLIRLMDTEFKRMVSLAPATGFEGTCGDDVSDYKLPAGGATAAGIEAPGECARGVRITEAVARAVVQPISVKRVDVKREGNANPAYRSRQVAERG